MTRLISHTLALIAFALTSIMLSTCKGYFDGDTQLADSTIEVILPADTINRDTQALARLDSMLLAPQHILMLTDTTWTFDTVCYMNPCDTLHSYLHYKVQITAPSDSAIKLADQIRLSSIIYCTHYETMDFPTATRGAFSRDVMAYKSAYRSAPSELRKSRYTTTHIYSVSPLKQDERMYVQRLSHSSITSSDTIVEVHYANWDKKKKKQITLWDVFRSDEEEYVRQAILKKVMADYNVDTEDSLLAKGIEVHGIQPTEDFVLGYDSITFHYTHLHFPHTPRSFTLPYKAFNGLYNNRQNH